MRRGLMSWSREEMPIVVLEARVARLQAAMREAGLHAVLAYTSFAQPAAVHWLTNFTPYWSEALLIVLPEGQPILLAALTPRVHTWIREVSHLGELISAPKLGATAAALLGERVPEGGRVGVIGLDALRWSVGEPLLKARGPSGLVDAGALYRSVRQPADASERALATRAAAIGIDALRALPHDAAGTSALAAAAEAAARHAGAEELLQRVAPDLRQSGVLLRLEGDMPLGEQYAVELSVAYKGAWVRVARSIARTGEPRAWAGAQAWFERAVADLPSMVQGRIPAPPGCQVNWTLEASTMLQPLSVIASSGANGNGGSGDRAPDGAPGLVPGSLSVFSVTLQSAEGWWLSSTASVTATDGVRGIDLGTGQLDKQTSNVRP